MFGAVMVIRDVAALRTLQKQIALSDRLIALGTLAGGVAHEINTPTQYIGDSISFVQTAFEDLLGLLPLYREATEVLAAIPEHRALAQRIAESEEAADLAFIRDQLPEAFTRTRHGVERIATIVRAVKAMGHPGGRERQPADLTEIVRNTLIVAGSEYRHLADIETRFDPMDAISCYPSELSQAILNLIVNAAQAIGERSEPSERGLIRVVLEKVASSAVISITDTGCGISPAIADRIFDPFFTTKPVGKGTGQGLTIARAVVVDKHGGELTFFSEPGKGSTFIVRLPMKVSASA